MKHDMTDLLFSTQAFVAAPAGQPFWYTSGLFGPYYINTHYLFGSKAEADRLLAEIEEACQLENRSEIARRIGFFTRAQYEANETYRAVIDRMVALTRGGTWDFVSGGERRDFFFSIEVARRLERPHLYIFKDGEIRLAAGAESEAESEIPGSGSVLHVADLITKASSYERAWLPALQARGLHLKHTIAGVDRGQGGIGILAGLGVKARTLVSIDTALFQKAEALGKINADQVTALSAYAGNEMGFVRDFLAAHPDFLDAEAARDERTRERVKRLKSMLKNDNQ